MGDMLTKLIDNMAAGRDGKSDAGEALIRLGVAKLPEIEKDNTDRNRTSPFAFTGAKFEFRAVGSSQSIAWPITLLNAAVAEAVADLTEELKAELKKTKKVDDAALKVVRKAFNETTPVRFEGNNYAESGVKEAARRGLPNLRRAPEALAQLTTRKASDLLVGLGILSKEELSSRYHVRVERYIKDVLIEMHTLREMIDTIVLPAAFSYLATLTSSAAQAKAAGVKNVPQADVANEVGALVKQLRAARDTMSAVIDRAEHMHDAPDKAAQLLTSGGADGMAEVRRLSDAIELSIADENWPLPKYREMLFPV
jgi:glutamine synthetase